MPESPPPLRTPRVRVADLDVDLERQTVSRLGERIELPDLSFRLLASLIRHAPELATKDDLIAEAWDGVVVSDETLAQRVRLLRQALADDSRDPRYIASIRGRGYRLVCPVGRSDASPPAGLRKGRRLAALGTLAALALVGLGYWMADTARAPATPASNESKIRSLAVLPFADLSADASQRYFADGMQEELANRLTRLGNVAVLSRSSVERFREADAARAELARQLGADALVAGSVRVANDRVRIAVQLIDAASNRHLWAETYDRPLSVAGLFGIQADVADQVAAALELELPTSGAEVRLPTDSLEAYDAYLLGRYHTFQQTPRSLDTAIEQLERAVGIDSGFAAAYATLGWAYTFLGTTYGTEPAAEVYPLAREAALRALALDSELADAHSLYADILAWYDWDFDAAEREYRRAQALDSLNVLGYALFLSTERRHAEAIDLVERRLATDPGDRYVRTNAAWRYLNAGMIDKAVAAANAAAGHPDAGAALGHALLAGGAVDEAIAAFEEDMRRYGRSPSRVSNLAVALVTAGRRAEAAELLTELEALAEDAYVSPALFAAINFAAGNADRGFELLRVAVSERAREVIFLQVSRMLDGYRDDPRYAALVESVGFRR